MSFSSYEDAFAENLAANRREINWHPEVVRPAKRPESQAGAKGSVRFEFGPPPAGTDEPPHSDISEPAENTHPEHPQSRNPR